MTTRRGLLLAGLLGPAAAAAAPPAGAAAKVLRYAFPAAETGFDPAKINDLYSRNVTAHVFEAPYRYDYLARPALVRPNTAAAMPDVRDDFRTWTVPIRPGIWFADDPAFGGRRRELVAADYVYTLKRFFDPATKSPVYSSLKEEGMLGVDALRDECLRTKRPFDYDREVDGLRAVDRYTLEFKLAEPRPRFAYTLADSSLYGAVAREVVEFYGDRIAEHPVGTGPFRLAQWRRSSFIALDRNPTFREVYYDAEPAAGDAEGEALLARFKGRRLPMVDRVEVSVIEEAQPRWLAFLNRQFDYAELPIEFAAIAVPNGKLAPNLAKQGITLARSLASDRTLYYFNMDDPLVGGYAPEKVALRRAVGLALDTPREIALIRRGQAIPAQSVVAPGTWGYDPHLKTESSDHDPARAKALLDLYGYADRDGDGWREQPDGAPLVIRHASQSDSLYRSFAELWQKSLAAVGLRTEIQIAQWPEQLKAARAGQLQTWSLGYTASSPDVQDGLQLLYGPASGGQNLPRFKLDRYDRLYDRMKSLPDGPERLALLREALLLVAAYAPHKYNVHRILNDVSQPGFVGFRRPPFGRQFWHYVDLDAA